MKISNEEIAKVFQTIQTVLDEKVPQDELKIIFSILTNMKKDRFQTLGTEVIEKDIRPALVNSLKSIGHLATTAFSSKKSKNQKHYSLNPDKLYELKNKIIFDTSGAKKIEDKVYYIFKNTLYTSSYLASVKYGLNFSLRLKNSLPLIIIVISANFSRRVIEEIIEQLNYKLKHKDFADYSEEDLIKTRSLCKDVIEYLELLNHGFSSGLALKVMKEKSHLLLQSPYTLIKQGKMSFVDTLFAQNLAELFSRPVEAKK